MKSNALACASLAAVLALLAACGGEKPAPAVPETPAAFAGPRNPDGTTLAYTRSNQDGAKPERILVHVVSATELHVAKMVEPCTSAAYVTAVFDPVTTEPRRLVGGRLQRDGTQLPQIWLDFDAKTRKLDVRFGDPSLAPAESLDAPPAPWRMYDFDLAEFALFGPREGRNFEFGLAMAWPDGSSPSMRVLGKAQAELLDSGVRVFEPFALYAVTGEAFGDDGGFLTVDPEFGHVMEARFGRPNHPGYDDFLLKLDAVDRDFGEEVWQGELAAHWQGCPS
jgi:hypothetical protein